LIVYAESVICSGGSGETRTPDHSVMSCVVGGVF